MNRITSITIAGTTALAALALTFWIRSKRKSPEEYERERRLRISTGGRITDGTVLDAQEMSVDEKPAQLVIYRYDVAGVSYEASQDITHLRQFVDLHTCRIGLPTSVKYDPQNPGNSIVIAEGWVGLRM
ncbi:MAG: hypothetical protein JWN45_1404 [Acidobacteriaceae bacterium]|jgi:hypothetical protein|nr:hypothetical protein [Acidobacteriaceae bacterium]